MGNWKWLGLVALAGAVPCAAANSGSYTLQLNVPLTCSVDFSPTPGAATGEAALGKLTEYCNSPSGYQVRMLYPAGAYEGVVIRLNGSTVVLDGSGTALLDSASGATSRRVELVATSRGPATVDHAQLSFAIEPR